MKARPGKYAVSAQVPAEVGEQLDALVAHAKKTNSRASRTSVLEQLITEKHKRLKL